MLRRAEEGLLFGTFTAISISRSAAFLTIVLVLILGGRSLPVRGELLDRLPALGTGEVRWRWLVPVVLGGGWLLLTVPDDWASALFISMATACVCLSVVVLTGYVGQLSLAQWGIAGIGAWIAARLNAAADVPFMLAVVLGIVLAVPFGVLLAIPALRTRGVNLAVLTLGLSVVLSELLLTNSALTGGYFGTTIDAPSLFGWSIDGFEHPGRYGVFVLFWLVLAGLGVANLRRSASGRRMIAVRDNERAAASLGIGVSATKIFAFAIAAALAATGGAGLGMSQKTGNFATFNALGSISIVVYSVLGGVGYVTGALIAGQFIPGGIGGRIIEALGADDTVLNLIAGGLLLVVLLANPNGVAHENARIAERLRAGLGRTRIVPRRRLVAGGAPPRRTAGVPLKADGVTVRFGGVTALDSLSIRLEPGRVHGLIGPNGAGKTTAIDAITGYVLPDSETRMSLGDERIEEWTPARRAAHGIGRTFQSLELFEDMTVFDNLRTACDPRSSAGFVTDLVRPRRSELSAAAVEAVRTFALEDDLDRRPEELPYGRRRLVAIARAVAAEPAVLLLDEPAAGLSSVESEELGRLITELARDANIAVLLVEHDVALVMQVCDVITVLDFGRTIASGTPDEIASNPAVVAAYLGEPEPA